jgi:cytochrome b involved in lipid metabolism
VATTLACTRLRGARAHTHPVPSFHFLCCLGQDATEAFEDVGHSDEARALLPAMLVGDFEQGEVSPFLLSHSYIVGPQC